MKNENYIVDYYCKNGRQFTKHLVIPFSRYIKFPSSLMSHLLVCERCGYSQTISTQEYNKLDPLKEKVDRIVVYEILNKKCQRDYNQKHDY